MSEDWLVRGNRHLELEEVVTALASVVPDLSLRGDRTGHQIVVVHDDLPLVWIGRSREVGDPWAPWLPHGVPVAAPGTWWTEVTGPTHRPAPGYDAPQLLVRDVAQALARTTAGTAVRLSAASLPEAARGGRRPVRPAGAGARPAPEPPPRDAGVADAPGDMVNDDLAVLVQSRPVVALTPWLVNNHVWAQAHERQFVLLTPAATELTLAAWSYLQNTDAAWVVDAGEGMYHGLIGAEVDWSGQGFELRGRVHPGFTPVDTDRWQLLVEAETTHAYDDSATIGGFSRDLVEAVGLAAPERQGLMEPPEAAFDLGELTTYARTLSPRPTRFVLQGAGWEAVLEAVPQPVGVVEKLTLTAAATELLTPEQAQHFLDRARDVGAESALVGYRRTSGEGHVPSRLTGPTVPTGLHLARRRFPTLSSVEAQRLGGPTARVDDTALHLTWSLHDEGGEGGEGAPDGEAANPAVHLLELLQALQHHDSHRHGGGPEQPAP